MSSWSSTAALLADIVLKESQKSEYNLRFEEDTYSECHCGRVEALCNEGNVS